MQIYDISHWTAFTTFRESNIRIQRHVHYCNVRTCQSLMAKTVTCSGIETSKSGTGLPSAGFKQNVGCMVHRNPVSNTFLALGWNICGDESGLRMIIHLVYIYNINMYKPSPLSPDFLVKLVKLWYVNVTPLYSWKSLHYHYQYHVEFINSITFEKMHLMMHVYIYMYTVYTHTLEVNNSNVYINIQSVNIYINLEREKGS